MANSGSSFASSYTPEESQRIIHNVALGAMIVCPVIMLLPPRKVDFYTFGLVVATAWGANQVVQDRTGRSIYDNASRKMGASMGFRLPEEAEKTKERLRVEKAERALRYEMSLGGKGFDDEGGEERKSRVLELVRIEKEREEREKYLPGSVKGVWLGKESEDWKKKRDERERRVLEEGKGYGWLIWDQVKEVYNGGKDRVEETKEKDEKAVKEQEGKK